MNVALRIFAGAIDLLQFIFFIVFLAFQLMTPAGGGAAGAAAGAYACYNASTNALSGIIEGAVCAVGGALVGAGLSAFAIPVGIVIDIAISCTFGVLLILLLCVTGRFSFMATVIGLSTEMMPGLNAFIPGWSLLVHRSIQQHKLKKQGVGLAKRAMLGIAGSMKSLVPGSGIAAVALKPALSATVKAVGAATIPPRDAGRVPLRNFDGIRPANDNRPQKYAQAA